LFLQKTVELVLFVALYFYFERACILSLKILTPPFGTKRSARCNSRAASHNFFLPGGAGAAEAQPISSLYRTFVSWVTYLLQIGGVDPAT
jgi:hypothetical protein